MTQDVKHLNSCQKLINFIIDVAIILYILTGHGRFLTFLLKKNIIQKIMNMLDTGTPLHYVYQICPLMK